MPPTRIVSLVAMLALAGCGGGGGGSTPPPVPNTPNPLSTTMVIDGAAQKGPFLVGSTVWINRLDNRGRSTTSTLRTEIEDSVGSFSFETTESGPVQIEASGYYFSELTGQISNGTLTLKALYNVSGSSRQVAHVNILTHLINDRVLELVADGTRGFDAAIAQAEDELVAALDDALVVPDLNAFSALSLYDSGTTQNNTLGNAYLLALSTGFYKYAEIKAREQGTATDAELTLTLNRIADDLATDGDLEPGEFVGDFITAIRSLSPETIAANLRRRSEVDYPQGLGVPDISVFLSLCAGNTACPWRAGAPMPVALANHASAVHDGKVYVISGRSQPAPCCNGEVYAYDPATNSWTQRQSIPQASQSAAAHTIGGRIYVALSTNMSLQLENKLFAYDPVANQWEPRADRPTYRANFASAVVNGLLYVIGGYGRLDNGPGIFDGEHKSHVEIYNPTNNTWSTGAPLPIALSNARACVVGDQIYVLGGSSVSNVTERTIYTYNTTSNSWSMRTPMETRRLGFECVTVDNAIYVVGGLGYTPDLSLLGTIERYDPFLQTWTSPARLQTARHGLAAASVGKRIFTFGGIAPHVGPAVNVVEILDTEQL
jgi:N-acetylneuraminic acid mutarotase